MNQVCELAMSYGQKWQLIAFIPRKVLTAQEQNIAMNPGKMYAQRLQRQMLCGGDKTFELFIVLHWHHILPFHYHIQWSVTNDLSS